MSSSAQEASSSLNASGAASMRLPHTGVTLVNLRSEAGMMVCANKGGSLSADRFKAGPWELLGFHAVNSGSQFTIHTHNIRQCKRQWQIDGNRISVRCVNRGSGEFSRHAIQMDSPVDTSVCGYRKIWSADEDGVLSCTASTAESNDAKFSLSVQIILEIHLYMELTRRKTGL